MKTFLLFGIFVCLLGLFSCQPQNTASSQPDVSENPNLLSDGTVNAPDGVPIHFYQRGSGSVSIVFVHGWCIDGSYWEAQIKHLEDRFRVVAIDLAGHGQSGTNRSTWTMQAFGKDVRAVVEYLNLDSVILVGHSMSEMTVIEAAASMPERVIGIIGVDTFIKPGAITPQEELDQMMAAFNDDFEGTVRAWIGSYFSSETDSAIKASVVDDMVEGPPEICAPVLKAIVTYANEGHYQRTLNKLRIPIHTINAVQPDSILWVDSYARFSATMMDGVGHYPMKEDPEQLNYFLDEVIAGFQQ